MDQVFEEMALSALEELGLTEDEAYNELEDYYYLFGDKLETPEEES